VAVDEVAFAAPMSAGSAKTFAMRVRTAAIAWTTASKGGSGRCPRS